MFIRKIFIAAAGLAAATGMVMAAAAGPASASSVSGYTQNGSYQFASNTADYYASGDFIITSTPQAHSDSSQALGANGVDLATTPGTSGYADSGVIVDLGPLSSLFNSAGAYVAPQIVGSANLGVNFYLDTNGSSSDYGTINASGVWTGEDGNNYASMGSASGSLDAPDWTTFAAEPGADTAFAQLTATTTMAGVLSAYQAEFGSEGVKTADPQVFAWIGISGSTAQTGYVTSVDGASLVTSPPPAMVTVPNVTGKTLGHALAELAAAGLKAHVKVVGPNPPHSTHIVIRQWQEGGTMRPPGSVINLTVEIRG
jgi:PASTA domain